MKNKLTFFRSLGGQSGKNSHQKDNNHQQTEGHRCTSKKIVDIHRLTSFIHINVSDSGRNMNHDLRSISGACDLPVLNYDLAPGFRGELICNISQQHSNQDQGESDQSSGISVPYIHELFKEGYINQEADNQHQSVSNNNPYINIQYIKFLLHNELLNTKASTKETIPPVKFSVNTSHFFHPFSLVKLGTIITAPNQPAERLTNRSDMTETQMGLIFTSSRLQKGGYCVNF